MKANRWITLFLLSVMSACMMYAQGIRVYKTDGTVLTHPYNEVDSLVAYDYSGSGDYAGHEYVDLGLSVKWATCNVGASSPSDYGDYFAWGEASTKSVYTRYTSETYKNSYGDIGRNSLTDAARANWGGSWRLPTKSECKELVNKCTWSWTTMNGKNGYKVTGRNGNSIFLPAAGLRIGSSLLDAGSYGYYWSSSPRGSSTGYAYYLYFGSDYHGVYWSFRSDGRSVRPVTE